MAQRAAIIGGGVIGGGWAARFLLMGWDVSIYDPDPEAPRKIGEVLDAARRSLPGLYNIALPDEGTLRFAESLESAVDGATWIQESVPERLEIKHATYRAIEAAMAPGALIGSSTSGFKPSELQVGAAQPDRILVAHPFNPVYLLPLVELVPGAAAAHNVDKAAEILTEIGMTPLKVRTEIDAHIADRFLEAVWREALWLVKDGVATTEDIDEAIRLGFGLRWAQMGLFETYRIAGGEAGMAHFLAQFGPALKWPWTKLMDVPELDQALIDKIAGQSDAQSGTRSIRDLERIRDDNLVAILRALKSKDWGAGAQLKADETRRGPPPVDISNQIITLDRVVPTSWTDYNGHMNETHYLEAISNAIDRFMEIVGADADYIAGGLSFFTAETHIRHLDEVTAGERLRAETLLLNGAGKRMHVFTTLKVGERAVATGEQILVHVDLTTRRATPPAPEVAARLDEIAAAHAHLPRPDGIGRAIGDPR